jgi:hypothetical protein
MVASWLEHLRQHHLVTNADRVVQDAIREFGSASEPPHPSNRLTKCSSPGLLRRPVTPDITSRAGTEVVRKVQSATSDLGRPPLYDLVRAREHVIGTVRPRAAAGLITNSRRVGYRAGNLRVCLRSIISRHRFLLVDRRRGSRAVAHQAADRRELTPLDGPEHHARITLAGRYSVAVSPWPHRETHASKNPNPATAVSNPRPHLLSLCFAFDSRPRHHAPR